MPSICESVTCCRCKLPVKDAFKDFLTGTTAGYYEVHDGYWNAFANPGEKFICDECMFKDERYIAVYGNHGGC